MIFHDSGLVLSMNDYVIKNAGAPLLVAAFCESRDSNTTRSVQELTDFIAKPTPREIIIYAKRNHSWTRYGKNTKLVALQAENHESKIALSGASVAVSESDGTNVEQIAEMLDTLESHGARGKRQRGRR